MKDPLTPNGIEPATFRFVAQHLNHCAPAVPRHIMYLLQIGLWGKTFCHEVTCTPGTQGPLRPDRIRLHKISWKMSVLFRIRFSTTIHKLKTAHFHPWIGLLPSRSAHMTNFIKLNRIWTTQLTVVLCNWLHQQHVSTLLGHHQAYKDYLSQYLTNLMHKICFTMSFISYLYMFRAHVLIIRRSGIITFIGGRLMHETATYKCDDTRGCVIQFWPPDDEHMCSKHTEAWNKTYFETNFVHQVG